MVTKNISILRFIIFSNYLQILAFKFKSSIQANTTFIENFQFLVNSKEIKNPLYKVKFNPSLVINLFISVTQPSFLTAYMLWNRTNHLRLSTEPCVSHDGNESTTQTPRSFALCIKNWNSFISELSFKTETWKWSGIRFPKLFSLTDLFSCRFWQQFKFSVLMNCHVNCQTEKAEKSQIQVFVPQ